MISQSHNPMLVQNELCENVELQVVSQIAVTSGICLLVVA